MMKPILSILISIVSFGSQSAFASPKASPAVEVMTELKARAVSSHSSAIIVVKQGRVVYTYGRANFNRVLSAQSVTKSVSALGYLMMLQEGLAQPLDTPLLVYYPAALKPAFDQITVRNVLTQSSGIVDPANLWDGHNIVETTLNEKPAYQPFESFIYSNAASMLAGDIVNQQLNSSIRAELCPNPASCDQSQLFPAYLKKRLFDPLGIKQWSFTSDEFGHLHTSGGLSITPAGLLKLGQLMLNKGLFNHKQIIGPEYAKTLSDTKVGSTECYALMTWLVNPRCGSRAGSVAIDEPPVEKRADGFYFDGFGGQYVVVIPSKGIVAIRMRELSSDSTPEQAENDSFLSFPDLISRLE